MVRLRMLRSQRQFISLDIGALDWYTRRDRACDKPLILLISLALRGNPSLSATPTKYLNACQGMAWGGVATLTPMEGTVRENSFPV